MLIPILGTAEPPSLAIQHDVFGCWPAIDTTGATSANIDVSDAVDDSLRAAIDGAVGLQHPVSPFLLRFSIAGDCSEPTENTHQTGSLPAPPRTSRGSTLTATTRSPLSTFITLFADFLFLLTACYFIPFIHFPLHVFRFDCYIGHHPSIH